jgi:apolipoprotein N-acyltransferase
LYHWFVYLYPLDFVGLDEASSLVVVLAGWLGLSLLQAIPGGLIFPLFRVICRSREVRRFPILKPFAFAAIWVIFEWSSTLSWTGVPWGRLCLGQSEMLPMLQISSVLGSYAVSFLLLAVNGFLAYVLFYRERQAICGGIALGMLFANFTFGLIRMNVKPKAEKTVTAAVIQGNINSHDKWDEDTLDHTLDTYEQLTREAASEGAELIVWPETALPYSFNESKSLQYFVSYLAQSCETTLIIGALYSGEEGEFNSLYLVESDGTVTEQRYDKRHLVPFGEYVPMKKLIVTLIPPLSELVSLGGELDAGKASALFTTEWGSVGSMICFDSIYEMLGVSSVRDGAELMVISSNDSWFYDSAAVYQHLRQAQLRAIEEGRYILRAANTGISAVISPKGEALGCIEPLMSGYSVCEVKLTEQKTAYVALGNSFVYLCFLLCMTVSVEELLIRLKKKKNSD